MNNNHQEKTPLQQQSTDGSDQKMKDASQSSPSGKQEDRLIESKLTSTNQKIHL